jgi:hypothetical protein
MYWCVPRLRWTSLSFSIREVRLMSIHRLGQTAAVISMLLVASPSAEAAILASDDFSANGSGTGWAAGSNWGTTVAGGISTWGFTSRNFAAPIDPNAQGKIYIAFDYSQTAPGDGSQWGGAAFFEGQDAGGDESFFAGNPAQFNNIGLDLKQGDTLDSGVAHDARSHRIITEIDLTAGGTNATYKIWVDSNNVSAPTAMTSITNDPFDAPWQSLRLAGDGATTNTTDNLVIATTFSEVGLIPEPATIALLGALGLTFIGAAHRRR